MRLARDIRKYKAINKIPDKCYRYSINYNSKLQIIKIENSGKSIKILLNKSVTRLTDEQFNVNDYE